MKPFIKTFSPRDCDGLARGGSLADLVDVGSTGVDSHWLQKRAASGVFASCDITPKAGHAHIHLIALGDADYYGCFFAGAPVVTDKGTRAIEALTVGDRVLTHKNRYQKVVETFESAYTGVRTELSVAGLPGKVTSTGNHPFLIVKGDKLTGTKIFNARAKGNYAALIDTLVAEADWLAASSIQPGDFAVIPCAPKVAGTLEVPAYVDPYILGFYSADGCLVREYRDIASKGTFKEVLFTLSESKRECLEYLQTWYTSLGREPNTPQASLTSSSGIRIGYGHTELAAFIAEHCGVTTIAARVCTCGKHISPLLLNQSDEFKLKLLAGYMDGDGCAMSLAKHERYNGTLKASTAVRGLALDIQRLCGSLGIGCNVSLCYNYTRNRTQEGFGEGKGDLPIYALSIGASQTDRILAHCKRLKPHGRNIKGNSRSSFRMNGRYMLAPVRSVASTLVEDTVRYNIEVEEDNSYVVDIQGHNSNRNGDIFYKTAHVCKFPGAPAGKPTSMSTKFGNRERAYTFEKHAKVYREHNNRPDSPSFGTVVKAAHNDDMNRVELIIEVPEEGWRDDLQKIASGKTCDFSMACTTDPDYLVRTQTGYRPIVDIQIGELVHTHTGAWKRVTALNRRKYTGKVYTLRLNGLPAPLTLTADHLMMAKIFSGSRDKKKLDRKVSRFFKDTATFHEQPVDWAHVNHLQPGDRIAYRAIDSVIPGYCAIESTELAAIMGYYIAEGSFGYNGDKACTTQFSCNLADSLPRRLPALVQHSFPGITVSMRPHYTSDVGLSVEVYSTQFSEMLRLYVGKGCRSKYVCAELFNSSTEVKLAFLGAWCDGNGWCDVKGVHWSTVSLSMALQARDLLFTCGLPASIYKIDHAACATSGKPGSGDEYTVNLSYNHIGDLAAWSEKVATTTFKVANTRKYATCIRTTADGQHLCRVKRVAVDEVTDVQTYNLEVEGDESYTFAGLISHNCRVPADICSYCGNVARSTAQYCDHLKGNMSSITKEGHMVGAINDYMTFFDISRVGTRADRIAVSLVKSAGLHPTDVDNVVTARSFIDVPDIPGYDMTLLTDKRHGVLRKLAELEKEIGVTTIPPGISCDLEEEDMTKLESAGRDGVGDVLASLADAKITLSVKDFMRLVAGKKNAESIEGNIDEAEDLLPGVFSRLTGADDSFECDPAMFDPFTLPTLPRAVKRCIGGLGRDIGFSSEPVTKRITVAIVRGGSDKPAKKLEKKASVDELSENIARMYGLYKVAACMRGCNEDDYLFTKFVVLQNYV